MTEVMQKPAIANATQKLREGASELKSAVVEQGSEAFQKCYDTTEASIKEYPYRSVLIAFGVGAILGALLFRR
jgi:ElaB/YqjD/DUF883 family membrane-anchored ribosome-binding protein